jgi:hypothetical protein
MNYISKIRSALPVFAVLIALACNKDFEKNLPNPASSQISNDGISSNRDGGSGPTILGNQRANAFHVDVVRQAYNNLYEPDVASISPTHLYVRFLPQNPEDVGELLHTDLDFWDYPLDHDVIYSGEFYHDPALSDTNYTWMYAVVPPNFNFSAVSVTYEVLAPIVDPPCQNGLHIDQ